MRKTLTTAILILGASNITAHAATVSPPSPPAFVSVDMNQTDIQVTIISIVNAGAACDAGVKVYCQIPGARDGTLRKLQSAIQSLESKK